MEPRTKAHKRSVINGLLLGFVVGAVLMLITVVQFMPGMMIVTRECPLSVDEAVARLESSLDDYGWASPGTLDLTQSMANRGVEFDKQVRVVQMCHPEYAKAILAQERYVSSLMPCGIAVWEGDDGKTHISKMNTGLMGNMFGGIIAEIMGNKVSADEHAMLSSLVE